MNQMIVDILVNNIKSGVQAIGDLPEGDLKKAVVLKLEALKVQE